MPEDPRPDGQIRLVLASQSPRRRMLLEQIGLTFEVLPVELDEAEVFCQVERRGSMDVTPLAGRELAAAQVREAAIAKATAACRLVQGTAGRCLFIGADTVVLIDGQLLGKPTDECEAARMLRMLAGRTHSVLTGVAVLDPATGPCASGVEISDVTFTAMNDEWIEAYVRTGEPMDKAGAYAVQGLGSVFIQRVEGCYFNVVGLPLSLLARLLRGHGFEVVSVW